MQTGGLNKANFEGPGNSRECLFCGKPFAPRRQGRNQKFCPGGQCNDAFRKLAPEYLARLLRRRHARSKKSENPTRKQTAVAEALQPLTKARKIARRLIASGHAVHIDVRLFIDGVSMTAPVAARMFAGRGRKNRS